MTATERPYNFSAGPAILPSEVTERAAAAVREFDGIGLSLIEISHRSNEFSAVSERAHSLARSVLRIPESHEIVLLQGGASLQFVMVPMNLGRPGKVNCYVDTGAWSSKAIKESKVLAQTRVLASSEGSTYDHLPEWVDPPQDAAYLHVTTNNTIYGTEYPEIPDCGSTPLVIDASSHIGSRPMNFERVGLGYAGAQKNLGPSGVTLVFVHRELLDDALLANQQIPHFLRYSTHIQKQSMYNTPNTFGFLVLQLVLEWIEEHGGVEGMERRNREKAGLLYDCLDASSVFTPHARTEHRSLMNITWTLGGAAESERATLTEKFVKQSTAAGLSGLKGHRSVGGLRASIYNAFPRAGVETLVEFMKEFERTT